MFYHWTYWQAMASAEFANEGAALDIVSFHLRLLLWKLRKKKTKLITFTWGEPYKNTRIEETIIKMQVGRK